MAQNIGPCKSQIERVVQRARWSESPVGAMTTGAVLSVELAEIRDLRGGDPSVLFQRLPGQWRTTGACGDYGDDDRGGESARDVHGSSLPPRCDLSCDRPGAPNPAPAASRQACIGPAVSE